MCNKIYNEVLNLVASETEISPEIIVSKSRVEEIVDARQLVVWFCFKAGLHPRTIAEKLGISRQAVCQKIQTIANRRADKAFEYIYKRCEVRFADVKFCEII